MEKREFFATQSIWVRLIPSAVLTTLLFFAPWLLWSNLPEFRELFGFGFVRFMAILGVLMLHFYFRMGLVLSRKPIPLLMLDEQNLSTPLGIVTWEMLGRVQVKNLFGRPRLFISTVNDNRFLKTLKPALAITVGLRRWLLGAPIVLPPLRDVSYAEVCSLIERYRDAALTPTA